MATWPRSRAGVDGRHARCAAGWPRFGTADVSTSARLSAYLARTTGVRLVPGWLRVLLHRQRFACGRLKHTLEHLQDPAEVAACEEALRLAGEKGGRGTGALRTAL